jgi:proteasome alpha subunit
VTMPFYSSVDQLLRDRSELARKGISRGRSVVVLTYTGGVLFVAENRSTTLHKVSEIYDRIGFAAVGRYNEFETLRNAGIRMADVRGYSYDRRDVTGRMLANFYAQVLGTSFVEQQKPYEVELCLAGVGQSPENDQLYRVTYDGSITDEPQFVVMGGTTDPISAQLKNTYRSGLELGAAISVAVQALQATATPSGGSGSGGSGSGGNGGSGDRVLGVSALEVAVLDRTRPRRTFRRITGSALRALLPERNRAVDTPVTSEVAGGDEAPAGGGAGEDSTSS